MGMLERSLAEDSRSWTRLRIWTKCEESFSEASAESFGAQRLEQRGQRTGFAKKEGDVKLTFCSM